MSTTAINLALTTQSNAAAAQAQIAADQAHTERCLIEMGQYQPKLATTAQMQSYAACVHQVHPEPISADAAISIKVAIIIVIVCMLAGNVQGWREEGDMMGSFMFGVMGAVVGCCMCVVLLGIAFVIS